MNPLAIFGWNVPQRILIEMFYMFWNKIDNVYLFMQSFDCVPDFKMLLRIQEGLWIMREDSYLGNIADLKTNPGQFYFPNFYEIL